jgi:hypothetical protein
MNSIFARTPRTYPKALFAIVGLFVSCAIIAAEPAPKAAPANPTPEFRAARSVHLGWQAPPGDVFYNEIAVEKSVPGSYFMAVGWNTGYFGIQEIKPDNKVVIFSVWDPTKGDDPKAVPAEQRVEVLHQDPDVRIKRFGGEGTGGQCMWGFNWRLGETYRFCLRATIETDKTAYAAFFYLPEEKRWKHLATFRTRNGNGSALKGYYSFVEDFRRDKKSVNETRRARFQNGWVRTHAASPEWVQLTRARFTASNATFESKENIDAGTADGAFYLATGGEISMSRPLRSMMENVAGAAKPPDDLPLQ